MTRRRTLVVRERGEPDFSRKASEGDQISAVEAYLGRHALESDTVKLTCIAKRHVLEGLGHKSKIVVR